MAPRRGGRRRYAPPQHLIGGLLTHDAQGNLNPKPIAVSKSAPELNSKEHQEQSAFFSHLFLNHYRAPELARFRAIPNGGWRGERREYRRKDGSVGEYSPVGKQMQAEGVKPGTPDVCCPLARRGFHGLWLEFKVNRNGLEDAQREDCVQLIEDGYAVHVVWTWVEALHVALWYLQLDPAELLLPSRHVVFDMKRGHDERCGEELGVGCALRVRALPTWNYPAQWTPAGWGELAA